MTWVEITPRFGARSRQGVTVSWRKVSARATKVLVVTLGRALCVEIGLTKGKRMKATHNMMAGKLRLEVVDAGGWLPTWKEGCAATNVPLDHVTLTERKPAQTVAWERGENGKSIELRLPPWACPPVQITPRPAIPLRETVR